MAKRIWVLTSILLITVMMPLFMLPGMSKEVGVGEIIEAREEVTVYREGRELRLGEKGLLFTEDLIIAGDSPLLLKIGPHQMFMSPKTIIKLTEYKVIEEIIKSRVFLKVGKVWAWVTKIVGRMVDFEIETEYALAGVRGTVFAVEFSEETGMTWVYVDQGEVEVADKLRRRVRLYAGFETYVAPGKPPEPPEKGQQLKGEKPDFQNKPNENTAGPGETNKGPYGAEISPKQNSESKGKKGKK